MVASHRKEVEQGAEPSPRPSFLSKSSTGSHSHQLGMYKEMHNRHWSMVTGAYKSTTIVYFVVGLDY